ncbi:MAG: hypothetical protein A2X12_06395 [Bacteroidetes bacterium GWE2_29_8]|nr:MAG: hypothetical protein A2X12_06395 [Bacteroidetes bacterium GWE2_29_8]
MQHIVDNYKKQLLFLVSLILVWIGWYILNDVLVEINLFKRFWLFLYHIILRSIIVPSSLILENVFGMENIYTYREIFFLKGGRVEIANNCLGLSLMYIYSMFIAVFPIKAIKLKIIYILIGIVIIDLLNLIRVVALSLISRHAPQYLDINHYYVFNIITYSAVFFMWVIWMIKVAKKELNK